MGNRRKYKRLIDQFIVACQWCWYGIADKVRLCLARKNKTDGDLVSIIMPTIGRDLTKALESVLAQTHKNWELIIVGDGCWFAFETAEKVIAFREWLRGLDKRITVISTLFKNTII